MSSGSLLDGMEEFIGTEARTSAAGVVPTLQITRGRSRAADVQERLEHIADMLIARRRALASEIVLQVKREIPEYRSPPGEAAEHIAAHIDALAATVRGRRLEPSDYDFIAPHAARRARDGVPLSTFLHAFRLGIRVLWDTVVADTGTDVQARAAALSATRPFLESLNASSTQAAAAYLEAQETLAAEGAGARRDLLEQLLAGRPVSNPRLRSLAAEAGLQEHTHCAVVVAMASEAGPPEPDEARAAANELIQAASGVVRPLSVARHDELVIVRALRAHDLAKLSQRLGAAQLDLAQRGIPLRLGISTEHAGRARVPNAYAEAHRAAQSTGADGGVLSLSELSPADYLASHADEVAARLVPEAVRSFISEDLQRDGALVETVLAYAAADMNLSRTAERLHIHVNTARYRLTRIAERTGCEPRSLGDMMDLVLAIKMLAGPRTTASAGA
ncbi:MAG TPA: helix-turn-helix domain-containing protein [Solirubrobacteraceae bacterium]|jgi:sugar diacid utilization regulator|nr:helix-turn-helix domain-containing protein [Solirubrobacteraceae bacterium]